MANGAFNFKNNSGNIVSFISGSGSDIIISGGTLDLSGMSGLTLGNLTMEGTVETASFAPSYLLTSSFNTYSGTTNTVIGTLQTSTGSLNSFTSSTSGRLNSIEGVTGSYATTGSNTFNGNLTVTGYIDAQELRTTYISSSILYRSGSTKFGDELTDTHAFTGSMLLSGSLTVNGTSTIQNTLTLNGSNNVIRSGNELRFNRADNAVYTRLYDAGSLAANGFILDNINGEGFHFQNNGATIMRMNSSGNVGINRNNPTRTLDILGATGIGTLLKLEGASGTTTYLQLAYNGATNAQSGYIGYNSSSQMQFFTNDTLALTIDSNRNLGLGVTPSAWNTTSKALQLPQFVSLSHQHNGDLNLMSFALETSTNTFTYADTGVFPARLNMNPNNGSITFFGAGTGTAGNTISWSTRFLISSTGNVGIGTSSPASRLNIVGGTSNAGSTSTSDYSVVIQDPTSMVAGVGGSILLQGYKTSTSAIGNFAYVVGKKENGTAGNEAGYLALGTFDSAGVGFERMRITSDGNVLVGSTNADVGGSVKGAIIRQNGSIVGATNISSPIHYQSPIAADRMNTQGDGLMYGMWRAGIFQAGIGATNGSVMTFFTGNNDSMTERMRITSGGNMLLQTDRLIGLNTSDGSDTGYLAIAGAGGDGANRGGHIYLSGNERVVDAGNVTIAAGNISSGTGAPGAIVFRTGDSTERMRITSDGKVIVRQSNFTYPVSIEAQSGGGQLALTRSGAYTEFYMGGTTGGGTQLYVRSGGSGGVRLDAGSTGWVADSDIRLKDIEKPIENAVESLSTLQTVYYSWKDSENEKQHLGLIAQEVESVFPEIVSESSITGMKGVNYIELIPVLVKAIQEQQTIIENLKSRLETLENN